MGKTQLRDRIIQTAAELFYQNGYNSTGINEIIAKSGIAKATLYSHFKSKEDLCLSYLQHMNVKFLDSIKEFCFSKPASMQRVLSIFDYLEEFFDDRQFNGCWCIKTVAEIPKDNTKIRAEIQNQKGQFIELLKELTQVNYKGKSTAYKDSKVKQIYLLYESAVGESHLHQKNWPIQEAKTICAQII